MELGRMKDKGTRTKSNAVRLVSKGKYIEKLE